jgi:putative tricarboxylic transport membrane protein
LIEHDLFGKPVSTFPDHALKLTKPLCNDLQDNAQDETGEKSVMGENVMAEETGKVPEKSGLLAGIRGPQDFVGGLVLIGVAAFAFWASSDLSGMHGFSFGPGTAPRLFAGMLLILGTAVAATGFLKDGSPLQQFSFRGPFFVTVAVLVFSVAIRPLGLIASGIITFLIAAMGSHETRWVEAIIVGVLLTLFCAFLFPYVLGLPFQLLPLFMQ